MIYKKHKIKKNFGQNFLNNKKIIKYIINIINPQKNDKIIEIGPGFGALTNNIIKKINNITVIEIDDNLVKLLSKSTIKNNINIINKNVLKVNFFDFFTKNGKKLRIVGSIPYNISTALIFKLFNFIDIIVDIYLVLQKEVVNRLIANPNCKFYGKLSIFSQYYYKIIPILELLPEYFFPIPKVDSILVRMIPYKTKPYIVKDISTLSLITNLAFNQRRKIISNSLKSLLSIKELEKKNINPMLRAENITIYQYCKLANFLTKKKKIIHIN